MGVSAGLPSVEELVAAIHAVAGNASSGLHEPVFAGNEKAYLNDCIDTGFVSSVGEYVTRFEQELVKFTGAPHAIAVVNGTTALHLALVAIGVMPGDEVIVPALGFVATANAVAHAGATPHFVDVGEKTWGLDPVALGDYLQTASHEVGGQLLNSETGRPITAIVPMHTLGHPVDMAGLMAVAEKYGLAIVEDAAESLGSFIGDTHTGLFGRVGVFSFNGNKTITTGGGGALVTSDAGLASRIRHLSTTARIPHRFEFDHDEIGYNYRMPNINAALGVAQMEQLPGFLASQLALFERYRSAFADWTQVEVKTGVNGTVSNYWLQALYLAEGLGFDRDEVITKALGEGVPVRPMWKPLNQIAAHATSPSAPTPVAQKIYERVVCLPSSTSLGG